MDKDPDESEVSATEIEMSKQVNNYIISELFIQNILILTLPYFTPHILTKSI